MVRGLALVVATSILLSPGLRAEEVFSDNFDSAVSLSRWEVWREGSTASTVEWNASLGSPDAGSVRLHVPTPAPGAIRLLSPCYSLVDYSTWTAQAQVQIEQAGSICKLDFLRYETESCSDEARFYVDSTPLPDPGAWVTQSRVRSIGNDSERGLVAIRFYLSMEGEGVGGCLFDSVHIDHQLPAQVPALSGMGAWLLGLAVVLAGLVVLRRQ